MKYVFVTLLAAGAFIAVNPAYAEKKPETEEEKFSYAVGVQLAQNLLRQSLQLDAESLVQAITDVLNQSEIKLTAAEMQEVIHKYQQKQKEIQSKLAVENQAAGKKFLAENKTKEGVVELPSGLQYKIIKKGEGEKPTLDSTVVVHYRGTLLDGKEFDSSYKRGEPTTLSLNHIIKGWQEALTMMETGSKWQVFIPPELGYGEQGAGTSIPPNSTLIFDIELISIQ